MAYFGMLLTALRTNVRIVLNSTINGATGKYSLKADHFRISLKDSKAKAMNFNNIINSLDRNVLHKLSFEGSPRVTGHLVESHWKVLLERF